MRKSELSGLEWIDINSFEYKISINRNSIFIPRVGLINKAPKSEKSKRVINMQLPKRNFNILQKLVY